MASRFTKIKDPAGNEVNLYQTSHSAFIERLDGRNPLYKYYKYRFCIRGGELSTKFLVWMRENFGPSMGYGLAKHYIKCNQSLDNVPWVQQNNTKTYWHDCQIYFNQDCEVLVRLKFMQGATI